MGRVSIRREKVGPQNGEAWCLEAPDFYCSSPGLRKVMARYIVWERAGSLNQ